MALSLLSFYDMILRFEQDAREFEKAFARDVRFLHNHNHDHECSGTCVKNVKKKTNEQLAKLLKDNRAPPCRFEFDHVVEVIIYEKVKKMRNPSVGQYLR